jgi:hypothetical protein
VTRGRQGEDDRRSDERTPGGRAAPPSQTSRSEVPVRVQAVKSAPDLGEFEGEIGDLLALLRDRTHAGVTPEEEAELLKAASWLNNALAHARRLL